MSKKIIVACGGTGGHAFPGIAVARELRARGHHVTVWNSGRSIEGPVMKSWDGPTFSTGAKQLSAKNVFANIFALIRCRREMKRQAPDALLAMGSYSSLPPVLAAAMLKVPVILHEANAVPGKAIDFLSRFAKRTALTFPSSESHLAGHPTAVTGLPVRAEIANGTRLEEVPPDMACVFVTGGSQGAHRVNELASQALVMVRDILAKENPPRGLFVIHQTGAADEESVLQTYVAAGLNARVRAFESEMPRAFASADIVIARAGASTCFELAAAGKPAFFLPLPTAVRNHQHFNAQYFVIGGGADAGDQNELTPRALARAIANRLLHPDELAKRAAKMKSLATPDAAARVADLVENPS